MEDEKKQIEAQLSGLTSDIEQITKLSSRMGEIGNLLEEKEMRWLEIDEIRESDNN